MTSNPGLSRREEIALACHKAKSAYDLFVASPTRTPTPEEATALEEAIKATGDVLQRHLGYLPKMMRRRTATREMVIAELEECEESLKLAHLVSGLYQIQKRRLSEGNAES